MSSRKNRSPEEQARRAQIRELLGLRDITRLEEIDKQAEEMLDLLIGELACKEGVSEQVKAENQMAWVQKMNSIRNRAEEIILTELIYC